MLKNLWTQSDGFSRLTGIIVLFLVFLAFAISYNSLRELAFDNGFPYWATFAFPLLLDAFVIASKLHVLRKSLIRKNTIYPWTLVVSFSFLAVYFNVVHMQPDSWETLNIKSYSFGQFMIALCPLAVLLGFHLFIDQVKDQIKVETVLVKDLIKEPLDNLENIVKDLVEINKENPREKKRNNLEKTIEFYRDNPKANPRELASFIEVSEQTAINYLKELEQAKRVKQNGKGVKIIAPN